MDDAEADPVEVQARQPAERMTAGEGRPVVGAEGPRAPVRLKDPIKDRLSACRRRRRQRLAGQNVAGEGVLDRERIAVRAALQPKLALEIGRPDRARPLGTDRRAARVDGATSASARPDAPGVLQDLVDGAASRPPGLRVAALKQSSKLAGAPGRLLVSGGNHGSAHRVRGSVGAVARGSRAVGERWKAPLFEAGLPLVPGRPRDPEAGAELCHGKDALLEGKNKLRAFGHRVGMSPGHEIGTGNRETGVDPSSKGKVLPMLPR